MTKKLYPDTDPLKAALVQIKNLESLRESEGRSGAERLSEMRIERDRNRTIAEQWKKKSDEADEAVNQLKDELHASEIENARLKGYIDRVDMDLPEPAEPLVTVPLSRIAGKYRDPNSFMPSLGGINKRPLPWWRRK